MVGVNPSADPAALRRSYESGELTEAALADSWLAQLQRWYDEAAADARIGEPNAMQVATVDEAGRPDIRTVLARGFDPRGVVFYTNYT
jgi:pyridoxamine 5'-phosphate oxidase